MSSDDAIGCGGCLHDPSVKVTWYERFVMLIFYFNIQGDLQDHARPFPQLHQLQLLEPQI